MGKHIRVETRVRETVDDDIERICLLWSKAKRELKKKLEENKGLKRQVEGLSSDLKISQEIVFKLQKENESYSKLSGDLDATRKENHILKTDLSETNKDILKLTQEMTELRRNNKEMMNMKADCRRLLDLLKATKEYKNFAFLNDDIGLENGLCYYSFGDPSSEEELNWVPREVVKEAERSEFKGILLQFLKVVNRIYKERERRHLEKMEKTIEAEKRKIMNSVPYKTVVKQNSKKRKDDDVMKRIVKKYISPLATQETRKHCSGYTKQQLDLLNLLEQCLLSLT